MHSDEIPVLRSSAPNQTEPYNFRDVSGHFDDDDLNDRTQTPDLSTNQDLLTAGEGKIGEEKVSGVAATIYLEMNRCIKVGNLKAFREAIAVSKQIIRSDELRGFHGKLAEHRDSQT